MLTASLRKRLFHRKQKIKNFGTHEEFLARIAKSLYYVQMPLSNCTSLPVTELAAEIFSQTNKFSLNRLDIEKAAYYTRNGCISPSLLVLSLLYLERLKSSNPKYLTKISSIKLFLISLLVGSKFLQDGGEEDVLYNTDLADLTGLTVQEINEAEKEFLDAINWKVYVSEEEFWNTFNLMESKIGLREGNKRGWFTYTELNLLLQLIDTSNVIQCFWNVISACILSYTASVLALVGSALLVSHIPGLALKHKVPMTAVDNWNSTSPSNFSINLIIQSEKIQNFQNESDIEPRLNITESEFFNLSYGFSFLRETCSTDAKMNFLHSRQWHLSQTEIFDIEYLVNRKSDRPNSGLYFCTTFNVWIWSDYIPNFLILNTIPRSFYFITNL